MNVTDPYYIGALPSVVQLFSGIGVLVMLGWFFTPRKK